MEPSMELPCRIEECSQRQQCGLHTLKLGVGFSSPLVVFLILMGSYVAQKLVVHLGFPGTPRHLLGSQFTDRY